MPKSNGAVVEVNRLPKDEKEILRVVPIKTGIVSLRLEGMTPLVVHKFSEKARRELSRTESKVGKKKGLRKPEEESEACRYLMKVGGKTVDGFPAAAFKKAMVSACTYLDGITKVAARGGFQVNPGQDLIPLTLKQAHRMREDIVRIGMGSPEVRWRPEYFPWSVSIDVHYVESFLSASDVFNLLNWAGQCIGVGEGRPEKGGDWGMFRVALD